MQVGMHPDHTGQQRCGSERLSELLMGRQNQLASVCCILAG